MSRWEQIPLELGDIAVEVPAVVTGWPRVCPPRANRHRDRAADRVIARHRKLLREERTLAGGSQRPRAPLSLTEPDVVVPT